LAAARHEGALPNVVILDWKMVGMDGLATARAIRATLSDDECPIVIMATASSLATMARQPGAELIDAVLNKPVTASALYNVTMEARSRRAAGADRAAPLASRALAGIRILVVDDSEINRDVALRILQAHGAQVSLATDGKDALAWIMLHQDEVDVVLMDVQMPVMDGIEATRQLRRMPQFDDLPIVALTAGVFKSQQDMARAAGMTQFVSKPFDVPATVALIQRIRRGTTLPQGLIPAAPDHAGPGGMPTVGSPVIDVERGLQIWTDIDSYRRYLRHFASNYGDAVDVINTRLGADDSPGAAALAHKLAGVAGNLALPDTQRMALEAERVLAMNHDAAAVLARLREALGAVMDAVALFAPTAIEERVDAAPDAPLPSTQALAYIAPLFSSLLAAIDTDHPGPIEAVLAELSKHLRPAQLLGLGACVAAFDFRGAQKAAIALANELGIQP